MELSSWGKTGTEHGIQSKVLGSATCLDSGRQSSLQMVGENAVRELGFVVVVVIDKYFNTMYFSLHSFHSWGQWDLGCAQSPSLKDKVGCDTVFLHFFVLIPCSLFPIAHERLWVLEVLVWFMGSWAFWSSFSGKDILCRLPRSLKGLMGELASTRSSQTCYNFFGNTGGYSHTLENSI